MVSRGTRARSTGQRFGPQARSSTVRDDGSTGLWLIPEIVSRPRFGKQWLVAALGIAVATVLMSGCNTDVVAGATAVAQASKARAAFSGAGVSSASWDYVGDTTDSENPPRKSPEAVEPQLAKVTRVCGYDRPGTTGFDDQPSRSSSVSQPTTAQGDASTLYGALRAAGVSPPYVLVAHS